MPSYESVTIAMVLKNRNRIEEGEIVSNEMRKIFYQPRAEQVLQELKERYVDNNFTYSVRIAPKGQRFRALLRVRGLSGAVIAKVIRSYGEDPAAMAQRLSVSEEIWKNVLRSFYIPEKVLLYRLILLLGMRQDDVTSVMQACGAYFDTEDARDVVVRYLIDYRVFNREMMDAAFDEFHIRRFL